MQINYTPASSEHPRYRSGAVARMVRIPVSTLRIWERRYQVVGPTVTDSGHRLYSGADVERLLLIKQLVDLGHAIGSLAKLPTPALLDIADTRAALATQPSPAPRPRTVLLGLGLPRRLGASSVQRVATWADLASAEAGVAAIADSAEPLQADLLVADLATLQPESASRLLALAGQLGVQRGLVIYGFGSDMAAQRLRQAGWQLSRAPLADAELRTQVAEAAAALGAPAADHGLDLHLALAERPVPPRRFDDEALAQLAAASTAVACECPRHVAELVMLLANFETYSAECVQRGPADEALHRHLLHVAGLARAMFEGALQRVAEAESLPLPPPPTARRAAPAQA